MPFKGGCTVAILMTVKTGNQECPALPRKLLLLPESSQRGCTLREQEQNGNTGAAVLIVFSLSLGQRSVFTLRWCIGFGSMNKQVLYPISNTKNMLGKSGKFFLYF